jgi:hypothetical protein
MPAVHSCCQWHTLRAIAACYCVAQLISQTQQAASKQQCIPAAQQAAQLPGRPCLQSSWAPVQTAEAQRSKHASINTFQKLAQKPHLHQHRVLHDINNNNNNNQSL